MAAQAASVSKADMKNPWMRTFFISRLASLERERSSYMATWRDLSAMFAPGRGRFLQGANNSARGRRKDQRIIDNTPVKAAGTMASGLHAGVSSPARPWLRFRAHVANANDKLNSEGQVKAWLDEIQRRVLYVFDKSNLYNALHTLYGELGTFGTGVLWVDEDEEDIVRAYPLTVGEYWLASSKRNAVDTVYRSMWWTVRQIVDEFGLDAVSPSIRTAYETGQLDLEYEIVHGVEPNPNAAPPGARLPKGSAFPWGGCLASRLPFRSVWFERSAQGVDGLLRVSGYEEFPCMAPRWDVVGTDTYGGSNTPGWIALGDAQQLQLLQRRSMELIDKTSKPPMVAHPGMKNEPMSQLPGGVTFDPDTSGKGYRVAYEIKPEAMSFLEKKITETQERIRQAFFADLWLMMTNSDRREITAREIDERREEKMLILGPVLERLHDELLGPLVERVFNIMVRHGMIPPQPSAIRGAHLQVEFISMLALAQKALTTGPIERLWQFGAQIGSVKPEALDRLDADGTLDNYSDMIGAPASVLVDKDKADQIRQARAQQQAQANAAARIEQIAKGASIASQIDVGGGRNAVQALMGA